MNINDRLNKKIARAVLTSMQIDGVEPVSSIDHERFVRVVREAVDVFGNSDDALQFLLTPHPLLVGHFLPSPDRVGTSPVECLNRDIGERAVMDILNKIRYGLPV